jgi:nucleoside-diphosphate-sugar epimerase
MNRKADVLMVGAGDIGRRVLARMPRRTSVAAATSSRAKRGELRRLGAWPVLADLDRPGSLKRLPHDVSRLIHCAPPQTSGRNDLRTKHLLRALDGGARGAMVSRSIVYLSTSGVYGDRGGARVSEASAIAPDNARAWRRVNAERLLARHARRGGHRLAILRVPGIYAADRLPIERIRAGTPAIVAVDDSYTNHIHADDLAAIVLRALARLERRRRPQVRIFNASDDSELRMGDWFDRVADAFGLPRPPRLPRAEVAVRVSPMLMSFMRESRRLDNTRLKRELRVRLHFPTVAEGLVAARHSA